MRGEVWENEGRDMSLSHVRALGWPVQLSRVLSSWLMRVTKCWGSRFSEVERWRWTGGTDLCSAGVLEKWKISGGREVWGSSFSSKRCRPVHWPERKERRGLLMRSTMNEHWPFLFGR